MKTDYRLWGFQVCVNEAEDARITNFRIYIAPDMGAGAKETRIDLTSAGKDGDEDIKCTQVKITDPLNDSV